MWRHPKHQTFDSGTPFLRLLLNMQLSSTFLFAEACSAAARFVIKCFWRFRCGLFSALSTGLGREGHIFCVCNKSPAGVEIQPRDFHCFLAIAISAGPFGTCDFQGFLNFVGNAFKTNAFAAWAFLFQFHVFYDFVGFKKKLLQKPMKTHTFCAAWCPERSFWFSLIFLFPLCVPVAPRKVFDVFVGLLECEARSFGCMVGRSFCEPTKAKVVEVLSLILFVACFCLFFSLSFVFQVLFRRVMETKQKRKRKKRFGFC